MMKPQKVFASEEQIALPEGRWKTLGTQPGRGVLMKPFDGAFVILWAEQPEELAVIEEILLGLGCRIQAVRSLEQLQGLIAGHSADLIVAALRQSFQSPLDLLTRQWRGEALPPVLVVTDMLDVHLYLEALQRGAFDGVGLPLDENELIRIAGRALEAHRLRHLTAAVHGA